MRTNHPEPKYFICSLASQAVRKMVAYYNSVLEPLGLTAQQVMALGVLWRGENMSLGEFAGRAGIGKAAAVTMIQRLENMQLVRRKPHPEDARLNVLTLTEKARGLAPGLLATGGKLERSIEAAVGPETMAALIKGLTTICELDIDHLKSASKNREQRNSS
ncbi:MAG: MarR family winged helix-turn-helix transcriptional regulator [Thermodesulfobacteriota bacterium]